MARNFNRERHTGRNLTGALIAGAFLTALTVESTATATSRRRLLKNARMVDRVRDGQKSIYILPGCRADGHYIGEMFEPNIQHLGTAHYEAYPEDGFSLESVKESLLESRKKDLDKPAIFYASSMGGMVLTRLLIDDDFRSQFGKIDKVIFDSSPARAADLDRGTKIAMLAASILPPSWTLSRLYRHFMRKSVKKLVAHSALVSDEQAQGHKISSANTPLPAVEGQVEFINAFDVGDGEGAKAAEEIDEMYYISAEKDPVVPHLERAYDTFNRIFGGKVLRIIDEQRPEGHADGPEFQEKIIELMEGKQPQPDEPNVVPLFHPEPSWQSSVQAA